MVLPRVLNPRNFYDDLLQGYYAKEIVRTILDQSGYMVFPYGYESAFSYIKIQVQKRKVRDTDSVRRVRSSPDLLVYDTRCQEVELLEVKLRNYDQSDIFIPKLAYYQQYWPDSLIALIAPFGHWFYAQYANKLKSRGNTVDVDDQFDLFENRFSRVHPDLLFRYKGIIADVLGRPKNAQYFPEAPDENLTKTDHNETLLDLLRSSKRKKPNFQELFHEYNGKNLASREVLRRNLKKLTKLGKVKQLKGRYVLA